MSIHPSKVRIVEDSRSPLELSYSGVIPENRVVSVENEPAEVEECEAFLKL
jgi:hypothetical protein